MDLGCYPIHALRTLLRGEPQVQCVTSTHALAVDAETFALLHFPGGVVAEIDCSMISPDVRWSLEITGQHGSLALSNYVVPHFGCILSLLTADGRREVAIDGPTTYEAQLDHVVNVMKLGHEPLTGGEDAIANMMVIDRVRELARPQQLAPQSPL